MGHEGESTYAHRWWQNHRGGRAVNAVEIGNQGLLVAAGLVVLAGLVSFAMRLRVESKLWIAAVRTIVQLGLLGLVLGWIFEQRNGYMVGAVLASMIINAGIAAVRRTERRFAGIWSSGLIAVTLSSVLTAAIVLTLVVQIRPWYEPRYAIPLLGMVLGNTLTGLSLCLDRVMSDLDEKRDVVEGWLALGATRWEACRPFVGDAVRTGMIPIMNSMSVVGIVSLPGMMTGQILAGAPPEDAVRYQIVVMFMIAGATSLGALLVGLLAFRKLVTPDHQLAYHRLRKLG
ncbi:MAG: iron export ABC transporter permease subunit FetB [Myxococcales bacterium]|nr:iron export ABC transporter permease subunit FetB [Myxococcales bacterium]